MIIIRVLHRKMAGMIKPVRGKMTEGEDRGGNVKKYEGLL